MSLGAMRCRGVVWLKLALVFCWLAGCAYDSRPSLGWHESNPHHGPVISTDLSQWPDAGAVTSSDRVDAEIPAVTSGSTDQPAADGGAGGVSGNAGASGQPQGGAPIDTAGSAAVGDAGTTSSGTGVTRKPVSCPTGLYEAQYSCSVESAMFASSTIPLPFRLQRRSATAMEATANAQISFDTFGGIMTAELTARLDCATGAFHADIENGIALVAPIPAAVPFIGAMEGQLDEAAGTLSGTCWLGSPAGNAFGVCVGTWTAPIPR